MKLQYFEAKNNSTTHIYFEAGGYQTETKGADATINIILNCKNLDEASATVDRLRTLVNSWCEEKL